MKLQNIDPDSYKYLQENDKNLLDFEVSNDEDDDNSLINDSDDKDISNENLKVYIFYKCNFLPILYIFKTILLNIQVTSDDSDFQPEEAESDCKKITMQLLKAWQQEIQTDK